MADQTERLRVIIEADGTATLSDGTRLAAEQVRKLGEELSRTGKDIDNVGASSEKTGQHIAGMGRDIAQGDWRGAAVNMGRLAMSTGAMEGAASLLGVTLGVSAVAVLAFAAAWHQAGAETERQANALLLTGNYAGLVGGQLNQMARDTASSIGASVGNTRQTMEALVASGRVTHQSLDEMAKGVELVAQFSGRSRESVTKDFAEMANGVATWAAKNNEKYHFVTFEQYKYIESLEKSGQVQEAMRVTSEALSQHMGGDLTRNMGLLEKGWRGLGTAASWAWDKMLNVGREQTTAQRVEEAQQALERAEKRLQAARNAGMAAGGSGAQNAVNEARVELETAEGLMRLQKMAAEQKSQMAQEAEAAIAADREKKKKQDDGDSTYARMSQQAQRRLVLARAEEEQGNRLTASERWRLETLAQIEEAEKKIGPQRANTLRQLVAETAAVLSNNEAQIEATKNKEAAHAAALKEYEASEREIQGLLRGNEALELQINSVGKTKSQIEELKAQRLDHAIAIRQEQLATLALFDASSPRLEQIQREIEALQQKRNLTQQLGDAELADEARRKAAAENKKYTEELRHDLTHALQRAFADSKDPLEAFGAALENTIKVRATRGMAEALLNPIFRQFEQKANGGGDDWLTVMMRNMSGGSGSVAGLDNAGAAFNALGNVYSSPDLHGHVNTVVSKPTMFAFAKGVGLMGEAGPEAIMPLKRGADGSLGVAASGGGGVTINVKVVNNTGSQVSVRQQSGGSGMDMELVLDMVDAGIADRIGAGAGQTSRALEGRFGLRTQVS